MVAPIAVAAGALVVAGGSVLTGYVLEKTVGDKDYSGRDAALDATLGMVPGAALVKPIGKIGWSMRKLRYFSPSKGDKLRDIAPVMAYVNRREIYQIGLHQSTTAVVGGIYDFMSGGVYSASQAGSAGAVVFKGESTVQTQLSDFTPLSGRRSRKFGGGRCGFVERSTGLQCVLRQGHGGRHRVPNV